MSLITVQRADGTAMGYQPSSNTDADRGAALLEAMAAGVTGDTIYLSQGVYHLGTGVIDLSLNGTGTMSLIGSGKYTTVIKSSYEGNIPCLVSPGDRSVVANLSIIGDLTGQHFQAPWGHRTRGFVDAILDRVYISAWSDGIYSSAPNTFQTFSAYGVTVETKWDAVIVGNYSNGMTHAKFYDCVITATADPAINEGRTTSGFNLGTWDGGTLKTCNCIVSATGGILSNIGYAHNGSATSVITIMGGQITTASRGDLRDIRLSAGSVVMAGVLWDPSKCDTLYRVTAPRQF